MTSLPRELRAAMQDSSGEPIRLSDPETNAEYVLLPASLFDRFRGLLAQGRLNEAEQTQLLIAAGLRAGWDDPEMDIYNDLS